MSEKKTLAINYTQQDLDLTFIPRPAIHSSQHAGWKNIHLAHYQLPAIDFPETIGLQHLISLPSWKQRTEVEMIVDGKRHQLQHDQQEKGHIEMVPAYSGS